MSANLENSAVGTGLEKVSFHSNLKEGQCLRMFKLPHNCTHFRREQRNAQNSPSQASTVCEPRTSRCSSWIQKRQRNRRPNCQHPLNHRKSQRIPVELFQILKDDAVKVLHSICQQIWKTQQWSQDWKMSVFIPVPKKGNAKECSKYHTIALISHTSKVMLKILQARLQQYVNHELPDVQAGFRKGRGTRDQIANLRWIIKKAREYQKNIYFCFIDYAKAFICVDHNKLWKILQKMGIPGTLPTS